jgi:adenosylcobinamide kinase/adenosylcobinamide-phosphate guanylyltransferase
MNKIIFITGGTRSGKSSFAEKLAEEIFNNSNNKQKIAYIATGVPIDNEFKERILIHKKNRSNIFETYEEDIFIDKQLNSILSKHKIFLIECLTTWLGNLYFKNEIDKIKKAHNIIDNILKFSNINIKKNTAKLLSTLDKREKNKFELPVKNLLKLNNKDKIIIFVSNEIGMGIVPDNKISRDFRDLLGSINQKIAKHANLVYFTCSGIPIRIK